MGMTQAFPYLEVNAVTVSGTTVKGTTVSGTDVNASTLAAGASEIGTAEIAAGAVTSPKQAFVGTGSPTVFGNSAQFGTGSSTAGSVLDVVFGTVFKAAPIIIARQRDGVATGKLITGSVATTGFTFITGGASTPVDWCAIGSL